MQQQELRDPGGMTAAHDARQASRWWALPVITLAQLMIVLDGTIVNIALPSMQADLGMSDTDRQWAVTAYVLAFGGLLLLGGRISGLIGHRRTFWVSLVGFAAASALGGAAESSGTLFAARAVQGLFAAAMAPAALSLLTLTFTDPRDRGKAFGVFGAMSAAGSGVGLLAGGLLTEYLSWRWCLWVNVPIAALALLGVRFLPRDTPADHGGRPDIPGALLSAVGLAALVYGFTEAEPRGWADPLVLALLIGGVLLLALFVRVESRVRNPLLPLRIVLHRARGGAYLISALMMASLFGCFLFLSYYTQTILGYSPVEAGLAIMVLVAGSLTGSLLIAARLLGRVDIRALTIPGLLAMAAGLVVLSRLDADTTHVFGAYLVPAQLLIGAGLGVVLTAATSLATADVSFADMGTASATFNAAQQVGGAIGTAVFNTVATSVAASYLRDHPGSLVPTGTVHGFGAALLVSTAVMLVAVVVGLFTVDAHRETAGRPGPAAE